MNEEKDNTLAIICMLVKVSTKDGVIGSQEEFFINAMSDRLGLTAEERADILSGRVDVKILPPKDEWERIPYFQMCVMASGVNGHFHEKEVLFCKKLGMELGVRDEVIHKIVELFQDYFPEEVPIEELRKVYQITHN
jgi:hypothetical protein